ncbi:Glutamate or tyrosine decarboxylase [Stigmatella aurantiaca]|uniref:Glutamate or tyrosine decarboxylase n=1 Tax=Stigmatella aurantiaca TaxID=41 RepID=A0A1H7VHN0_STIAU|nr:pyridoxal-dependent decarboxylase [Stigmatella aurantiaca]SEM08746.1 Glutamate or tyrosine decarboxylase [Stigmatella aurantiaca]
MKVENFSKHVGKQRRPVSEAPKWFQVRSTLNEAFPSPFRTEGPDPLMLGMNQALSLLNGLKPEPGGAAHIGSASMHPSYEQAAHAQLGQTGLPLSQVVSQSAQLFEGMPHWNHPLTMPNVIPPANLAGIISAMMTQVFSPNIIEGEYSWNVENSELESAAMLSHLIGWPHPSNLDATEGSAPGGLYTFGGSGCYFYAMKYALTRVLGAESRHKGIRTDAKILVSYQGHYAKENSSDWTGLGMDNVVQIRTDPVTNVMDLRHLEEVMRTFHDAQVPIAAVVCTMGTTDAFAVDDVKAVRGLVEKYPNPAPFGKTFIYCDAVIGWSWLTFGSYDFKANPLGFTPLVLEQARKNYEAVQHMKEADAVGCDFHKVGWSPYNCSIIVMRDFTQFQVLMRRGGSAYLQARTQYNPGLYTLEVSRTGAYSMAGWATLKFLGREGFQSILGGVLEVQEALRELLANHPELVCVNNADTGFVTLFRAYPAGVNAQQQYARELTEPQALEELKAHNALQERIADTLWQWFRDGQQHEGAYAPYISYTSGFRPTDYNPDMTVDGAVIYALKAFPMNLNVGLESMQTLLKLVLAARDEVAKEGKLNKPKRRTERRAVLTRGTVEDLVSGVTRRTHQG